MNRADLVPISSGFFGLAHWTGDEDHCADAGGEPALGRVAAAVSSGAAQGRGRSVNILRCNVDVGVAGR